MFPGPFCNFCRREEHAIVQAAPVFKMQALLPTTRRVGYETDGQNEINNIHTGSSQSSGTSYPHSAEISGVLTGQKVVVRISQGADEKYFATNYGCHLLASIATGRENTIVKLRRYILVKQLTYQALKVPSGSVLKTGGANAWKLAPVFVQGTLGENEEMPCVILPF